MKKILSVFILCCLLLALVACSEESSEKNNGSTNSTDSSNPFPDVLTEEFVRSYPEAPASDFKYLKHEDYVEIGDYLGTDPIVIIPEQIDGLPVTELGTWLFANNTPVRAVMIPKTVETLSNLFINNKTVELVVCDGVKDIEYLTFGNCSSLHTLVLGDALQSLDSSVFFNCGSLEALYIPPSVTQIDEEAFLCASTSLTLYGEEGSYIETFAAEHGIPFEAK